MGMVVGFYLPVAVILNFIRASDELPCVLWNTRAFLEVAGITLGFILCGSLLKIFQLARGGKVVAEMLSGRLLGADTSDLNERKLLNVVEVMDIASGTPVPPVYVLDSQRWISAFAAGHPTSDMVIGMT